MADEMDDIEDLLEAPYKMEQVKSSLEQKQEETEITTNGNGKLTNGNGKLEENGEESNHEITNGSETKVLSGGEESKSKTDKEKSKESSSKKSRKDRSRSRSKHRKRSRSSSRSKKAKRSKSKDRGKEKEKHRENKDKDKEKDKGKEKERDKERDRDRDRDRKKRSRSRTRSRTRSRDRRRRSYSRSSKSRTRSRSRNRHRSRSNSRRNRHSSRGRRTRSRSPIKRQRSPELTPEERDVRTVFCMQLSNRIRPRELEDFFLSVGKVRDVRLITDPRTKRSKGIAYIEFKEVASVEKAIALTGTRILGVPIIVKLSQAEKNRMPLIIPNQGTAIIPQNGPMKLYIGSLHVNINEEMLRGIFEPFGSIDAIVLCKDDFGRSKGYGFIQFSHAEDAKKAMEQLNNFELASRPIKVAPFIEKPLDAGSAIANLDNDDLDRTGVHLGPSGKLALMAKLAEGSGIKIPQITLDAIQNSTNAAAVAAAAAMQPVPQTPPAVPVATQCFLLSNMFDLAEESSKPDWQDEIREDVIEECTKYGGIVHIHIDSKAPDGNIYIKCPTIAIAMAVMAGLNGRYFAGKLIKASFIPINVYHQQFPEAVYASQILKSSS